jgi:hypothetical protein
VTGITGALHEDLSMCVMVSRYTSSSSSVRGAGGTPPSALQPTETYCDNPAFWFRRSSPEALHVRRRKRPLSAKGGSMGEKWSTKFILKIHVIVGFFNMPQSCDMGQTTLLPVRVLRIGSSEKFEGFGRELGYQRPAC